MAGATGNAPTSTGGVAGGAEATPKPGGGAGRPGNAAKSSLAIWAITAGSNGAPPTSRLLILMIVPDLDAFEDTQRILGKNRC
jgi:hypothetical protein